MHATLTPHSEAGLYPMEIPHRGSPSAAVHPKTGLRVALEYGMTSIETDMVDASFCIGVGEPSGRATFRTTSGRVAAEARSESEFPEEVPSGILSWYRDLLFLPDSNSASDYLQQIGQAAIDGTSVEANDAAAPQAKVFQNRQQVKAKLYPTVGKVVRVDMLTRRVLLRIDEARFTPVLSLALEDRSVPAFLRQCAQEFKAWATLRARPGDEFWIGEFVPLERLSPEDAAAAFDELVAPADMIWF